MAPKEVWETTALTGRKSNRVRLERLGIERLRAIARENAKLGGRPTKGTAGKDGVPK